MARAESCGAGWFARAGVVLLAASVGACSSFDFFTKRTTRRPTSPPTGSTTRASTFSTQKKDPKEAAKKFEEVDRQHPYSEWARKSLIMSAYAYYQAGEYDDCDQRGQALHHAASGQPGRRLRAIPDRLVLLRRNSRRHPRPGAHRKGARRARRVIRKYPTSEYAVSAKQKIEIARDQLAGKEMQIGRYYLEQARITPARSTASRWS